jgi:uncharacterized low-complexity protein
MKTNTIQASIKLATAMAVTLAAAPMAAQADINPFSISALESGYMVAGKMAEAKCGDSKAAEAKCGAKKGAMAAKAAEAKCGADKSSMEMEKAAEAKCGAAKKEMKKPIVEAKCGEAKCGGNK